MSAWPRPASTPRDPLPCDILGPFFYEGDLLTEPLPIRAGAANIGDRSGTGCELDDAKVARYRVD